MHFFFLLLRLLKFLSIHDYFQLILKIYLFLSFLTEIFLPGFHFSFVPFLSKSVFFLCFYFKILYSFVQIICNFIFYLDCAPLLVYFILVTVDYVSKKEIFAEENTKK